MKELSIKDLVKHKVVPFCVYNEKGQIIMYAGETLTPGKLMELKEAPYLLYDEKHKNATLIETNEVVQRRLKKKEQKEKELKRNQLREKDHEFHKTYSPRINNVQDIINKNKEVTEQMKQPAPPELISKSPSKKVKGLNVNSAFSEELQLQFILTYKNLISQIKNDKFDGLADEYYALAERIQESLETTLPKTNFISNYKLLGKYEDCHEVNVAIFSGALAIHLEFNRTQVLNTIMAGLIHDIGKTQLDETIAYGTHLSKNELKEYALHVTMGYGIAKDVLKLNKHITRALLEHHEYTDGSGYPRNISFDSISSQGQILSITNNFDNLISNRTPIIIENCRDAMKALLNVGSKKFSPSILYAMTNKFSLNDIISFSDILY